MILANRVIFSITAIQTYRLSAIHANRSSEVPVDMFRGEAEDNLSNKKIRPGCNPNTHLNCDSNEASIEPADCFHTNIDLLNDSRTTTVDSRVLLG